MSAPWLAKILASEGLVLVDWDAPDGTQTLPLGTGGPPSTAPGAQTFIFPNSPGSNGWLTRPFYKAAIAFFGQAWDNNGNGFMNYSGLINGAPFYPFANKNTQFAPPFGDTNYLPFPIWLPQGASVQVVAQLLTGASNASVYTARMIIYYFNQDPNLQKIKSLPGREAVPGGVIGRPVPFRPHGGLG